MNIAPIYLIYRFAYRLYAFLKHWYVDSFRFILRRAMSARSLVSKYAILFFGGIAFFAWALIIPAIIYYGLSDFLT